MKSTLRISLKSGERIFVNGAVLRVDRKVAVEFLNDVTFLLENHVLQPEQATTPLRQLYFIAQMALINPEGTTHADRHHHAANGAKTENNNGFIDCSDFALQAIKRRIGHAQDAGSQALIASNLTRNLFNINLFVAERCEEFGNRRGQGG